MGKRYDSITDELRHFIEHQPMFFVATAPRDGHVNVSPKGAPETFAVLGAHRVAYVDLFGSGIETVAHLRDNGRITVMFCAFEGDPNIVRLYGTGFVVETDDDGYAELRRHFDLSPEVDQAIRSIVVIDVDSASDSCGYVVPTMTTATPRTKLFDSATTLIKTNGADAIRQYTGRKNAASIDGLPGLPSANMH